MEGRICSNLVPIKGIWKGTFGFANLGFLKMEGHVSRLRRRVLGGIRRRDFVIGRAFKGV